MTDLRTYIAYLWTRLEGPKPLIIVMTVLAGLSGGLGIAAVNAGIESWAEGRAPWGPLALFVAAQIGGLITGYYGNLRAAHMVNAFVTKMRTQAVRRVSASSLRLVEQLTAGKLLAMLNYDTNAIGASVNTLLGAVRAFVLIVFALVYLAQISWVVSLLSVLAMVIGAATYIYQERRIQPLMERARRANADFHDAVQDLVRGAKETRLNPEGEAAHLRHIDRLGVRGRILKARSDVLGFTMGSVAHLALLSLLGLVAFLPPQAIAVTGVPVFQAITVMLYLVSGIETMVGAAAPVTNGRVAHAEYQRVWNMLAPETRLASPASIDPAPISLDCRGLTYSYTTDRGPFGLGPIDLSFQAPELVFFTGGNGSGKTTLLKCLTGLYRPDRGELRLNGVPITDANVADLRWSAASVFHDFHLFDALYGHSMAHDKAKVDALLEQFGLADKVHVAGRGFHSVNFSTGQRKRLGLVAALLLDRPILVLDEFGAEQDPEFRQAFYRHILPSLRDEGRLILAVTHDDRYFDACDTRIHLDYGTVTKCIKSDAMRPQSRMAGVGD